MVRRVVVRVIALTILTLACLEAALGVFDPLGLAPIHQVNFINRFFIGTPDDYWLQPGHYDLGWWSATVLEDKTRRVPDTGDGCRVAFFGDSITFGWGVNDEDTFANRLAQRWPGMTVINAGIPAYNSAHVRRHLNTVPYDLAYYVIWANDIERTAQRGGVGEPGTQHAYEGFGFIHGGVSAVAAYEVYLLWRWRGGASHNPVNWPRFEDDLTAIVAQGVHLIVFDDEIGRWVAERYPATVLPMFDQWVSRADAHPNAAGHAQIAASIDFALHDVINGNCQAIP